MRGKKIVVGAIAGVVLALDLLGVSLESRLPAIADDGQIPFHTHCFNLHIYLCGITYTGQSSPYSSITHHSTYHGGLHVNFEMFFGTPIAYFI